MIIRDMFSESINRKINGVIKVDQDAASVIEQEVREYVITKELRRHFINFFDFYSEAFDHPTDDIGVWISGFFGSGKSHFLKMLSYILENKKIGNTTTVELFRQKFADDAGTFMMIDKATRGKTESILFNIDIEGSIIKDKTAVIRVFAKMFYNHLGYYGENLKVAMMEQYIDQMGKTEEFRRIFEEKKGKPWVEQRKAFAFNGKTIIPTLMEVLDMNEEDAKRWFNDKTSVEFSISRLVEDIKAYVDSQPKNFRLLFMVDEVGQYVGTDGNMLLNLQSLTESLGSECQGKVWIMCTGQEAIDEIIKVRTDEFSRIQARFKTRLSLSSSSVDEVIQKRVLQKTPAAEKELEALYNTGSNDATLRNLFSFSDAMKDITGYNGAAEFAANFPFVPYQFIIMQKVFSEIRKHGNAGKNLSGGERSMLSGFQEAAQQIQLKDENALAPFYRFYDTVHGFLDGAIRRVIERCQNAADKGAGVEQMDVDVLKLLYMIRYVDDIPANVENIMILMADDIRMDKIAMREKIHQSLNRLQLANYVGRTEDTYHFLTDEEQDVERDIKNTQVDTSTLVERISQIIYGDIYDTKKFRHGVYDFEFDKMVDGVTSGAITGGMKLRFLTLATDASEKDEFRLTTESKGQALIALEGASYYDALDSAAKIRKYVKQKNVVQLPKTVQDIITDKQKEASRMEAAAMDDLKKAICNGAYYVDGEHIEVKGGDAKVRINQALEYLVSHVYNKLELIDKNIYNDDEIIQILDATTLTGSEPNCDAAAEVEEYLILQEKRHLPTSMFDVQSRFTAIPYGWREIDVAAVVALLINQQKVTIRYGGATVQPTNPKLPDMLRKKSEIGKTSIAKRQTPSAAMMKGVKAMLRDYFDIMDVPDDEDGLIEFIIKKFEAQKAHYEDLEKRYDGTRRYPDKARVQDAIQLTSDVLSQQKDNIALMSQLLKLEDKLLDSKEGLQNVESFFKTQVQLFDAASQMEEDLRNELDYISQEPEANEALNKIRLIVMVQGGFNYKKIPELNGLMETVRVGHERLLEAKRNEIMDIILQCAGAVHQASKDNIRLKDHLNRADVYFSQQKEKVKDLQSLALLDGLVQPLLQYKDSAVAKIEALQAPVSEPKPVPKPEEEKIPNPAPKKIYKTCYRSIAFPAKTLESPEEIDKYVESIREYLKTMLGTGDGIRIQ